jgi:hypothetical protein
VDSNIFQSLIKTSLPILVNEPAEYPKAAQDDKSRQQLLPEEDRNENALCGTPPQNAVLFCHCPGQVLHFMWGLTKFFADQVDEFHMYAEMGNDE